MQLLRQSFLSVSSLVTSLCIFPFALLITTLIFVAKCSHSCYSSSTTKAVGIGYQYYALFFLLSASIVLLTTFRFLPIPRPRRGIRTRGKVISNPRAGSSDSLVLSFSAKGFSNSSIHRVRYTNSPTCIVIDSYAWSKSDDWSVKVNLPCMLASNLSNSSSIAIWRAAIIWVPISSLSLRVRNWRRGAWKVCPSITFRHLLRGPIRWKLNWYSGLPDRAPPACSYREYALFNI